MSVPKHERLIEVLTDAFWLQDLSVTDPNRMIDVVQKLITILKSQPRDVDDIGALTWAGLWLEQRLAEETKDV